jgi:hypothetical protein
LLRICAIVESELVPAWVAHGLLEIHRLNNAQLRVLPLGQAESEQESFALRVFKKIDLALLPGDINYAKMDRLDPSIPFVEGLNTPQKEERDRFQPDLIIDFSRKNSSISSFDLNHHTVWKPVVGESNAKGFWEWYHQEPVTKILIDQYQDGVTTNSISSCTKTEYLSFSRNHTAACAKAIDVLIQAVRDKANGILRKPDTAWVGGKSVKPATFHTVIAGCKLFFRLLQKSGNKLFFIDPWSLFVSTEKLEFPKLNFSRFKPLLPPKDRIWADPFVVSTVNTHYVFIEEMPLRTRRGHLSCLTLNSNGEVLDNRKILEQPYHLSYPFVFEHAGTWFMIPESGENKTVDLYECVNFPYQWTLRKNILSDLQAYDSTVHFQDGLYWLFCTIQNRLGSSPNNDLHIFYSDKLFGDWTPHVLNPVISDPYTARPAGRIFLKDGVLYRPSQICVPRYGYGLSLNRITVLSKEQYREEQISKAEPIWINDALGIHTLNFSENFTVIDALVKRSRFF